MKSLFILLTMCSLLSLKADDNPKISSIEIERKEHDVFVSKDLRITTMILENLITCRKTDINTYSFSKDLLSFRGHNFHGTYRFFSADDGDVFIDARFEAYDQPENHFAHKDSPANYARRLDEKMLGKPEDGIDRSITLGTTKDNCSECDFMLSIDPENKYRVIYSCHTRLKVKKHPEVIEYLKKIKDAATQK